MPQSDESVAASAARIRKAGGPAALEDLGQDVGRVGEEVAAEVVGHSRRGQLLEVLVELLLEVAPGEVGVGLREAEPWRAPSSPWAG